MIIISLAKLIEGGAAILAETSRNQARVIGGWEAEILLCIRILRVLVFR